MDVNTQTLVKMVKGSIQGKVLTKEQLASVTTGWAKLNGASEREIPQLIKDVEVEVISKKD